MSALMPPPERWARLNALLDESLDLDDASRARLVDSVRATDPGLADELAKLHAAGAATDDFMKFPVNIPDLRDGTAAATLSGLRIGAYRLQSPLGQGGMGTVWRAQREDGRYEGDVAIKLLHLSLLEHSAAQRFAREGTILAHLSHAGIARLFDAGVTPTGQPYLVLELVQGAQIDRHADAARLSIEQRITLMMSVLDAVAYAHNHLIVHRDLKPSNILVDDAGAPKLLDFGIAKLIDEEAQAAGDITREGGRALTPQYASPEQLRGDPVGVATDVYSLGVLLFELLCGDHPARPGEADTTVTQRTAGATEPALLSDAFRRIPPARRTQLADERGTTPQPLQRSLDGDLQNIVAMCLRAAPQERYSSAAALREDLRRYLAHEPVTARPDALGYRLRKFVRRHRGAVAAGAFAVLATVAGFVGTVTQARRANANAEMALRERDRALHDSAQANAAWSTLGFVLEERPSKPFTAEELLASAERQAAKQFAKNPLLRGELQLTLAGQLQNTSNAARAMALLERARQAAIEAGSLALQADVACALGDQLAFSGEEERATQSFVDAFALLDRLAAGHGEDFGARQRCLIYRGGHEAVNLGHADQGIADAQAALALIADPHNEAAVEANRLLGVAYQAQGQSAKAAVVLERAAADLKALGRDRTLQAANLYNDLAIALNRTSGAFRAASMYQEALDAAAATESGADMLTAQRTNLAMTWLDIGQIDKARKLLAVAMAAEQGPAGSPRPRGYVALASAQASLAAGDTRAAEAFFAQARSELEPTLPPQHASRAKLDLIASKIAVARERPDAALADLQRAWALISASKGFLSMRIETLREMAGVELLLGAKAAAEAHAQQAVDMANKGLAAGNLDPSTVGLARLARAKVMQAQGRKEEARSDVEAASKALIASLGAEAPAVHEAQTLLSKL